MKLLDLILEVLDMIMIEVLTFDRPLTRKPAGSAAEVDYSVPDSHAGAVLYIQRNLTKRYIANFYSRNTFYVRRPYRRGNEAEDPTENLSDGFKAQLLGLPLNHMKHIRSVLIPKGAYAYNEQFMVEWLAHLALEIEHIIFRGCHFPVLGEDLFKTMFIGLQSRINQELYDALL